MLDVAVRLLAGFLEHPEHGVNAILPLVPRENLFGWPADHDWPEVSVFNDADTTEVRAGKFDAPKVPAVVVWKGASVDTDVRGYRIAKSLLLGVGFVTESQGEEQRSNRVAGAVLRAATVTLARYNSQRQAEGYRELNGIKILEVKSVTEQAVTAAEGRRKLWGLLFVEVVAIDTLS